MLTPLNEVSQEEVVSHLTFLIALPLLHYPSQFGGQYFKKSAKFNKSEMSSPSFIVYNLKICPIKNLSFV